MGSHEFIVRGGAEEGKAVTTRAARGTRSSEGRPKQSWSAEWRGAWANTLRRAMRELWQVQATDGREQRARASGPRRTQ